MDGKMALYRECCFPNCTKVNKATFLGFRENGRPRGSAPGKGTIKRAGHSVAVEVVHKLSRF